MKKRVLFSACALAACFAACTNDDFQTEQNNTVINEAGEVIGADLVSSGMKMNINDGSADTRINENGQWETGDQIGLGWYKYKTAIDKEQLYSEWADGAGWVTDNNIYANILFTLQGDGMWQTQADVYQGAYFAYWPFQRMTSGSKLKTVAPNNVPQTDDSFKSDVYKNSLYLSAQDFIEYADVDESTMTLKSAFVLSPMVNAIGVVATPEAKIGASEYLKSMIITQMQISVGGSDNNIITPSATLSPRYLPRTINDDGSERTEEELRDELDKAAVAATGTSRTILADQVTKVNSLTTTIENDNFTLAKNNTLRAFAFPFQKGATYTDRQFPSAKVTVKSANGDWNLGTFAVNNTNSDILATNLKQMFDDAQQGEKFSMVQNILGEPGSRGVPQSPETMTANLTVKDFTPTTSGIKTVKHWNDLVTLVNELKKAGKEFTNNQIIFTLGDDLNFIENGEQLKTPDNVDIVLNTGRRSLHINGEVEWPAHLITNVKTANIVVDKDATLKVGIDRDEVVDLIASSIVNNGTIKAGAEASISADKNDPAYGNKLENNNMVIVEFGAYVYPVSGQEGIIAYEMDNNEPNTIGEINTLMELESSNTQKGYAQINTLILSNNVVLDLNAEARAAGEGNRYEDGSTAEYLNSLEDIDIIMRGASIVRKAGGNYAKVANITVEEGANTITDVEPQGNIDILKGSELTLASEIAIPLYDDGTPLQLADDAVINNEGTLYVNNTTTTKDFINEFGRVKVESDEKLFYVDRYIQGGIADGTVEKVQSSDPNAVLAQNVKDTFESYAVAIDATSLGDVVNDLNNKGSVLFAHLPGSGEPWASATFYMALSDWMKAVTGAGLAESGTPTEISVQMLTLFQSQSGITLL